jgi:hypothetical protein
MVLHVYHCVVGQVVYLGALVYNGVDEVLAILWLFSLVGNSLGRLYTMVSPLYHGAVGQVVYHGPVVYHGVDGILAILWLFC